MTDTPDMELVREFARNQSEPAFAEIVRRHLPLVYSVARRCTGDDGHAQDVAQAVFIILARKAAKLSAKTVLAGWLHDTTWFTATRLLRDKARRHTREQEAYMQSTAISGGDTPSPFNTEETWNQLAPHLEAAMAKLAERDRTLLVLRFYQNKTGAEAAMALGIREATAHKRLARALEKLRKRFAQHGVALSVAAIAGAVSANSLQAAPAGLAVKVSVIAAKGAATTVSITALVKGTMKTMTWLKYKFATGFGAAILLGAGATAVAFSQSEPTIYSLLANPPIISNATFEKEVNLQMLPPGFPAGAEKQSFSFSLDGENYRVDFGGGMVGRYEDTYWQTHGDQVTRYNLKWNKADSDTSGIIGGAVVARMSINSLLTFGITTGKKQNFVFDSEQKKLSFLGEDGNEYVADFKEKNGLPVSATIRNTKTGAADGLVVYHYDPKFRGGRLPVSFTRYWGDAVSEDKRVVDIRIQSLNTAKHHLPAVELDPDKFLQSTNTNYMPVFYSNNIPYWTDSKGNVRRVLTVEENEKEIQKIKARQKR